VAPWIAAGLLAACLVLALLPRHTIQGRGLALLRCFFPSWRFFEEIAPGPTLYVSTSSADAPIQSWREAWAPSPRTAAALLVNARGNLELAFQSLIDELWSELEDAPAAPEELIAYQLVRLLIEVECLNSAERAPGRRYRFKLIDAESGETGREPFVSREHEFGRQRATSSEPEVVPA
jgi:hypothetical protein